MSNPSFLQAHLRLGFHHQESQARFVGDLALMC